LSLPWAAPQPGSLSVANNHSAAGSRGAAAMPTGPRDPGQQSVHAEASRGAPQAQAPGTTPEDSAGTSLRLQVLEIIDSLLNSTGPELEELRVRLRGHVKEHPWDPETALLQYLWDREQQFGTPRVFVQKQGLPRPGGPSGPDQASR